MRVITFFAGGADPLAPIGWTAEEDSTLTAVAVFGAGIVTLDPDMRVTDWASGFTSVNDQFQLAFNPANSNFLSGLNFEIPKGQSIFVALSAPGGLVQLYIDKSTAEAVAELLR